MLFSKFPNATEDAAVVAAVSKAHLIAAWQLHSASPVHSVRQLLLEEQFKSAKSSLITAASQPVLITITRRAITMTGSNFEMIW